MLKITYALIFILILPFSATADLKKIDRGKGTWDRSTGYWLLFVARNYLPGHAYIVWGKTDRKKNKWASLYGYGKYPQTPKKAVFGTVPGKIVEESTKSLRSANTGLAISVSEKMYHYVLTNTKAIRSGRVPYHLTDKSCVDFVKLAADAIGLKTPDTSSYYNHPQIFIEKMKLMNN